MKIKHKMIESIIADQVVETGERKFVNEETINNITLVLEAMPSVVPHENINVLNALTDSGGVLQYNGVNVDSGSEASENQAVLDELSDNNGVLQYKGIDIIAGIETFSGNASDVTVADIDGNFASTVKNLENILKELFIFASDGKLQIATAITGKGVVAGQDDTFTVLAEKIAQISGAGSAIKKITKLNVTAPYTKTIVLENARDLADLCTSVLEYVQATGVVQYQCDFDNSDTSNFTSNDNIVFDGTMKCRTSFAKAMIAGAESPIYESEEIDINSFNEISSLNVNGVSGLTIAATPTAQIVLANGDIDLTGIESLDSITWNSASIGLSIALLVVSVDQGVTWKALNGGSWGNVNISDKDDVELKGMNDALVDALTVAELELLRNGSNTLRFGYYLDQRLVSESAYNDSISISISMPGYNAIPDTSRYSMTYEQATKTISYTFTENGTYTINYVD